MLDQFELKLIQIWWECYDRKKNVQSSGRLRFGGIVTTRKKLRTVVWLAIDLAGTLRPETKRTVVGPAMIWRERYDRKKKCTVVWLAIDLAGRLRPEKKRTVVGLAMIWRERYDQKKKRTVVWLA